MSSRNSYQYSTVPSWHDDMTQKPRSRQQSRALWNCCWLTLALAYGGFVCYVFIVKEERSGTTSSLSTTATSENTNVHQAQPPKHAPVAEQAPVVARAPSPKNQPINLDLISSEPRMLPAKQRAVLATEKMPSKAQPASSLEEPRTKSPESPPNPKVKKFDVSERPASLACPSASLEERSGLMMQTLDRIQAELMALARLPSPKLRSTLNASLGDYFGLTVRTVSHTVSLSAAFDRLFF